MKTNILIIYLFCSLNLFADIFNEVDETTNTSNIIFPITENEYREFVPLIQRELTEEELKEKREKEAILNKEVKNTFIDKEKIEEVKKINTEIKTDSNNVEFFDSLEIEEKNSAPIDMEDPLNQPNIKDNTSYIKPKEIIEKEQKNNDEEFFDNLDNDNNKSQIVME